MGLIFGNPAGFWALLGIPVILLIHFLQKERREIITSTLFLLENMQRESKSGIRFERLRSSIPLWLQILAVLLLTWLLVQPLWLRSDSFQRSVIVLDSSASMSVFEDETLAALDKITSEVSRSSLRQEWILLETDPRRGTLYSGDQRSALLETAAKSWNPRTGSHSPVPMLNDARALLRGSGSLIFLTNQIRSETPADIHQIAIGKPIENCGFTGLRFEEREEGLIWHVLLRNYGNTRQTREWRTVFDGRTSEPQTIELNPKQTVSLRGKFPENATEGFLELSGDRFQLDDWLPLIRPQPKPLAIAVEEDPLLDDFSKNFLKSLPNWFSADDSSPDLRFATQSDDQPVSSDPGIYLLKEESPPKKFLTANIVSENNRLMRDLNWQGLLVQSEAEISIDENDRVLLWQGDRPLIVLRSLAGKDSLLCNFDLRYSNAARLPAFVILLHRFIEETRNQKPVFSRENLQTSQNFPIAANRLGEDLTIRFRHRSGEETESTLPARSRFIPVSPEPGFLEVRQGENRLLQAAIHFADSREADFQQMKSDTAGPHPTAALLEKNTKADFLAPLWLLLLGTILFLNWRLTGSRSQN